MPNQNPYLKRVNQLLNDTDLLTQTFIANQSTDLIIANVEIKTLKRYIKKLEKEITQLKNDSIFSRVKPISIAQPLTSINLKIPINTLEQVAQPFTSIWTGQISQPLASNNPNNTGISLCSTPTITQIKSIIPNTVPVSIIGHLESKIKALENENQCLLECLECKSSSSSSSSSLYISSVSDSDSESCDSDCNCSSCNNHFTEDDSSDSDIDLSDTSSISTAHTI